MTRSHFSILAAGTVVSLCTFGIAADGDAPAKVRFALAGDSTVAENSGWGPAFAKLLASSAECLNFARGGQSSKSFRDSKNWQKTLDSKPNYILIQFGHNDQPGKGPNRETDPKTTYPENLTRFVDEARAIGAEPILITSMARRTFDNGKIRHDLEPYAEAVRKVAAEKKVPLIDLNARSIALLEKLGPEGSKPFDPVTKDGRPDHTHLSPKGGEVMALIVAEDLVKVMPKLKPYFVQKTS
jgi:lysophospholipase L1-like esterase